VSLTVLDLAPGLAVLLVEVVITTTQHGLGSKASRWEIILASDAVGDWHIDLTQRYLAQESSIVPAVSPVLPARNTALRLPATRVCEPYLLGDIVRPKVTARDHLAPLILQES